MFGYVTAAVSGLTEEEQQRYRAAYCGLCNALMQQYGQMARTTLSYDLTFLYLLLSSLYEPSESTEQKHCIVHPIRKHLEMTNDLSAYCADMNMLLSYYKIMDDCADEKNPVNKIRLKTMDADYQRIKERYPQKCAYIEGQLQIISQSESDGVDTPDPGANATAEILGTVYRIREDEWADTLTYIGRGLGRFIYLMDAYDDLTGDIRHHRYNPLISISKSDHYETLIKDSLTLMIAECTQAFETLPLVQDLHLLRNILYAGCWTRYENIFKQHEKQNGTLAVKQKENTK